MFLLPPGVLPSVRQLLSSTSDKYQYDLICGSPTVGHEVTQYLISAARRASPIPSQPCLILSIALLGLCIFASATRHLRNLHVGWTAGRHVTPVSKRFGLAMRINVRAAVSVAAALAFSLLLLLFYSGLGPVSTSTSLASPSAHEDRIATAQGLDGKPSLDWPKPEDKIVVIPKMKAENTDWVAEFLPE